MNIDVDFLRLIWQSGMFVPGDLRFSQPGEFVVENRGVVVEGADADFSGAVVRVNGVEISGGVRVDLCSSHWREQGDLSDPKYDNVVLHVVAHNDVQLIRRGRAVATCVITPRAELVDYFVRMRVDCSRAFEEIVGVEREQIISGLLDERIARKAAEVRAIIAEQRGSWHEAAYICFMRALGSAGECKEDFESIARSLPYSSVLLHADRPQLVEALMLGQAGHLDVEDPDFYISGLQREFCAARSSTGILPALINWKPVRRRPYSSLPLTLARAAAILCAKENLFEDILKFDHVDDLRSLFIVDVPEYWQCHSAPMKGEGKVYGPFSRDRADLIIINFVIPMLLAHASINSDDDLVDRAIRFYEELPAEPNKHTRWWAGRTWRARSAYDSQALVQLGGVYCAGGLCSRCAVGRNRLLAKWRAL